RCVCVGPRGPTDCSSDVFFHGSLVGICARFSRVGLGTVLLMPANKTMYASIWVPMYDSDFTEEFACRQAAVIVANDEVPSIPPVSVERRRIDGGRSPHAPGDARIIHLRGRKKLNRRRREDSNSTGGE